MAAATVTPLVNISEYWYEYISPSAWTKNINRQFVVITYKFIVVTLWSSEPGPILMVGHVRMMGSCRSHSTHRVAPVSSGTTLPWKNDITNMKTTCTIFASKKKLYWGGAAGPGAFIILALPKKGVGTNPCQDLCVDLTKCSKVNLKW